MKQSETMQFSLAYRYANPLWTADRNQQVYGFDSSLKGLGGNFSVTVEAETMSEWSPQILKPLKDTYDHKCLFEDIPEFRNRSSTLENITLHMAELTRNLKLNDGQWLTLEVLESRDLAAIWNFETHEMNLKTRAQFPMQWRRGENWGGGVWEVWVTFRGQVDAETGLLRDRQELRNLVQTVCQSQSSQVHSIEGDITPLVNEVGINFSRLSGFQGVDISVNRHQTFRLY